MAQPAPVRRRHHANDIEIQSTSLPDLHGSRADALGADQRGLLDVVEAPRASSVSSRRLRVAGALTRRALLLGRADQAERCRDTSVPETQSITGTLHRIEARGWVQRTPDPNDRRAVGITLTASGHKLTAEIVEISKELYRELFASALTAADKRQIEVLLKKVRAAGFKLPETDFKLRRAQQYPIWKD